MPIAMTTVVKQAKEQLSCKLDEEVAILNLKSSLYFGLDEVGAFIWQKIEKPISTADVCRAVTDRYDVAEAQCRTDVLSFLNKLDEAGLLETESVSADAD